MELARSVSVCNCFLLADSTPAVYALQFVTDEIVIILMHQLGLSCCCIAGGAAGEEKGKTLGLMSRNDKLRVRLPRKVLKLCFSIHS